MNKISKGKHTHSGKLERWLGAGQLASLSAQFKDFYYPVRLNGVPGEVYVMPGGDFAGAILAGGYADKDTAYSSVMRKVRRKLEEGKRRSAAAEKLIEVIRSGDRAAASVGAFASIDAIVAAVTGGKAQRLIYSKTGVAANAIGNSNDLWTRAGMPVAGGAGSAAPAGVAPTSATTGNLGFKNLGAANSGHYLNWVETASVANMPLLLYDRIFAVVKTMNNTAVEAVSGVPTRYQNTVAGSNDYIGGNFLFPANPTTVLAATAHNWTVCTYTDQDNSAGNTLPSAAGVSACVVGGIDLAAGPSSWFMPLATGDIGIRNLTQMQCSALVATGTIDFVIGHPIAVNVCPIANVGSLDDGVYTTLNLSSILDSACLSFIEMCKTATTATNHSGIVTAVSE